MSEYPLVSIIIPCRNEEKFIGKCLDSVIANDYPKDRLEVLVVDGMSEDGTRRVVAGYTQEHPFIRLLNNAKKHATAAFNIGVKCAKGEVIMIMGAHATYDKGYISNSVKFLYEYDADNVGGVCRILPRDNTLIGRSIAAALASPLGSGNAYTKIGSKGPRWVDTVFGGCYKKEVFEKIGLFNEALTRSQDIEFNLRLKKRGGKILLVPEIKWYYYVRSGLKEFSEHNFDDGFWTFYPLKFGSRTFYWRHLVPLVFVLSLLASAVLAAFSSLFLWLFLGILSAYALANMGSSIHIAIKEKSFKYLPTVPLAFVARHIPYGLGGLYGLLKVLVSVATLRVGHRQ